MLYRVVRPPDNAGPAPRHLELVADNEKLFSDGNHVFVSISGEDEVNKAPRGLRTVTVSTHVRAAEAICRGR